MIHGRSDRVVPVTHGEELYRRLRNPYPPLWVDGAGHTMADDVCFRAIGDFITHLKESAPRLDPTVQSPGGTVRYKVFSF